MKIFTSYMNNDDNVKEERLSCGLNDAGYPENFIVKRIYHESQEDGLNYDFIPLTCQEAIQWANKNNMPEDLYNQFFGENNCVEKNIQIEKILQLISKLDMQEKYSESELKHNKTILELRKILFNLKEEQRAREGKAYCVIGGQYKVVYYGSCPTLLGAKRLATKCAEYWDNWQGWHKPDIYLIEDTEEIEPGYRIPIKDPHERLPYACYDYDKKRWERTFETEDYI